MNVIKKFFIPQKRTSSEVEDFNSIGISLASPEKIRSWSFGEIKNQKQLTTGLLNQRKTVCFAQGFSDLLRIMSVFVANIKG